MNICGVRKLRGAALSYLVAQAEGIELVLHPGYAGTWVNLGSFFSDPARGNLRVSPSCVIIADHNPDGWSEVIFAAPGLYRPTEDWNLAGEIIEKGILSLSLDVEGFSTPKERWYAECGNVWCVGETPLLAACRAYVIATLGHDVYLPETLTKERQ